MEPPPFIQDRSLGSRFADEIEALAASGANREGIHRRSRSVLSRAYSTQGRRFANNFPRGFELDLSEPQFRRIATNMLRANSRNWHGYERELKYLNVVFRQDSPFRIMSAGARDVIRDGRLVEFDALLENKTTGMRLSAEFKDWKINSTSTLDKAKEQIDKIAMRAREEGVDRSIWVNRAYVRKSLREELDAYARGRGVKLYHRISTSERLPHNLADPKRFDDVLNREANTLGGLKDAKSPWTMVSRVRWGSWAGRSAGAVGAAYGVFEMGRTGYSLMQGELTTREATISASAGIGAAVGGGAGAWGGVVAGGAIGSVAGPAGTTIGGIVGGVIGGLGGGLVGVGVGELAGSWAVEHVIFSDLEERETEALLAFLHEYYDSRSRRM